MDHFTYKNNLLHAEAVSINKIASEVGTPFYCYSTATLERHYNIFADSFKPHQVKVCFAVKSNSNLGVLQTLAKLGSGADVVSQGEIMRALKVGIKPSKIVFSGVGKTREEMAYALKKRIFQFNVESEPELYALNEVAKSVEKVADISIRVNPDVDSESHRKISTGKKHDKFGVDFNEARKVYAKAAKLSNIKVRGISTHIGSQIVKLSPFKKAFKKIKIMLEVLRSDGHKITRLDLGGGLGIPYSNEIPPSPQEYADMVKSETKNLGCELIFEPGRMIAGNSGIMVSKVLYVKSSGGKSFLIIDAGMNDLARPSLYDAYHDIIPVKYKRDSKQIKYDVVGPVCETGDIFGIDRKLPEAKENDLIAFRTAGAYGAVMSSTYNSRPLAPEVLVKGGKYAITKPRQSYQQMLAMEKLPEWV